MKNITATRTLLHTRRTDDTRKKKLISTDFGIFILIFATLTYTNHTVSFSLSHETYVVFYISGNICNVITVMLNLITAFDNKLVNIYLAK